MAYSQLFLCKKCVSYLYYIFVNWGFFHCFILIFSIKKCGNNLNHFLSNIYFNDNYFHLLNHNRIRKRLRKRGSKCFTSTGLFGYLKNLPYLF